MLKAWKAIEQKNQVLTTHLRLKTKYNEKNRQIIFQLFLCPFQVYIPRLRKNKNKIQVMVSTFVDFSN